MKMARTMIHVVCTFICVYLSYPVHSESEPDADLIRNDIKKVEAQIKKLEKTIGDYVNLLLET